MDKNAAGLYWRCVTVVGICKPSAEPWSNVTVLMAQCSWRLRGS